jgi:hypothetical protein
MEPAELLAAHAVVKQGCEDGAIADALESVFGGRIEQLPRLCIAERQRAFFIAVGHWPLHPVDRIAGDGVALAEIVEEGRQGRELTADAGGREIARLEVLSPGNDMRTGDNEARRIRAGRRRQQIPRRRFCRRAGFWDW